jgi:hypothetical protein
MVDQKEIDELRDKAHKLKINQSVLAERWGVKRSTVTNKLSGKIRFVGDQLQDLRELIKQKEQPHHQPPGSNNKIIETLISTIDFLREEIKIRDKKIAELTIWDGVNDRRKKLKGK